MLTRPPPRAAHCVDRQVSPCPHCPSGFSGEDETQVRKCARGPAERGSLRAGQAPEVSGERCQWQSQAHTRPSATAAPEPL